MGDRPAIASLAATFDDLDATNVIPLTPPEPLLRVAELAYLRFERPDLARQRRFLEDFGIAVVAADEDALYGGAEGRPWFYQAVKGRRARFLGFGFTVASPDDLETVAAWEGAGPIQPCPGPGGGHFVRLFDPDGNAVDFVHGRSALGGSGLAPAAPRLAADGARINRPARPPLKPAEVRKLGHLVIQTPDFQRLFAWYVRHAGIIASDAQVLSDGTVNLAFCRLDRGEEPADHHTLAIAGGVGSLYMHSAYEVDDLDSVGQGQQVLKAGGWRHGWGIGRHYYGSQIFDYWRDPYGALMEHYADGDRFDAAQPTRYSRFSRGSTWMWGHDQPRDFDGVDLGALALLARNLFRGTIRWSRLKLVLESVRARPRPWLR